MRYHSLSAAFAAAITFVAGTTMAESSRPELYRLAFHPVPAAAGKLTFDIPITELATGKVVTTTRLAIPKDHRANVDVAGSPSFHIEARPASGDDIVIFLRVDQGTKKLQQATYLIVPKKEDLRRPASGGAEPISITLRDADVRDVFRTFEQLTNRTFDVDHSVTGKITVSLHETPWDEALSTIASQNGLKVTAEGNTYHITRR